MKTQSMRISFLFAAIAGLLIAGSAAMAANPTPIGAPGDGIMDLVVEQGGTAVLDTNEVAITGFVIKSLGGNLAGGLEPSFDQSEPGLPLAGFSGSTEFEASSQLFNDFFFGGAITGIINLGQLFNPGGVLANIDDLDITYTIQDTTGIFDGHCIGCIPEPSSIVLLVMGLAGLWGIRRRRA